LFSLFSESHRRKQPNSDLYYRTYMFRYIRSWKKPLGYISPTGSVYYLTLYVGDQIFLPRAAPKPEKVTDPCT
jgi:hypothetical protein